MTQCIRALEVHLAQSTCLLPRQKSTGQTRTRVRAVAGAGAGGNSGLSHHGSVQPARRAQSQRLATHEAAHAHRKGFIVVHLWNIGSGRNHRPIAIAEKR